MRLVDCFSGFFSFVLRLPDNSEQYSDARQVQEHCLGLIAEAQQCCKERGHDEQQTEEALFAVIVWADEVILCSNLPFVHDWPTCQLQLHFFGINNGGDEFYDRLDTVDRRDIQLLEIFAYCLALGFHGRLYGDTATLEARRIELNTRLYGEAAPSDKLFPSGYRSGNDKHGYRPPKLYALRTLVWFLIPLSILISIHFICSLRLNIDMQNVLGG
jgi:type VI secretion system protein ImpK